MPTPTLEELTSRLAALETSQGVLTTLSGQVDDISRQLQRLQGAQGTVEPQSSLSGYNETAPFVSAAAGNPTVVYKGIANQLLAGVGIRFERIANGPFLRIQTGGGLMNVDYVVDSNGAGTHLTLFGAAGAFTQAVADQADRVIWVCTTHTETVTTTITLSPLANEQQIKIMSGGPYRPSIVADLTGALFDQTAPGNAGTGWRFIFDGINFVAASGKSPSIYAPRGGIAGTPIEFWNCNFEGAGTWQYGLDLRTTGSASSGGMVWRNCRGQLVGLASLSSGGAAGGPMIVDDCILSLSKITNRVDNTDFEAGNHYIITNNDLTISSSSLPFGISYTTGATNIQVVIEGNRIRYTGTGILFHFGAGSTAAPPGAGSSSIRDISCNNNNIYCSSVGANAVFFRGSGSASIDNCTVVGNVIRGPGSGTAIAHGGVTSVTNSAFIANSFRDWTTYVQIGLQTTFPAFSQFDVPFIVSGNPDGLASPYTYRMIVVNSTGTEWMGIDFQRSGTTRGFIGLWDTTGPTTFTANDLYFGTASGDFLALQQDGTKWKVNTNELINGYLRVGATSSFTAPANTTAGDFTADRFNIGNVTFGTREVFRSDTTLAGLAVTARYSFRLTSQPSGGGQGQTNLLVEQTVDPSANTTSAFTTLNVSQTTADTFNITTLTPLNFAQSILHTGTTGQTFGITAQTTIGSGAVDPGAVTDLAVMRSTLVLGSAFTDTVTAGTLMRLTFTGAAATAAITDFNLLEMIFGGATNLTSTTRRGILFPDLGGGTPGNIYVLDIPAQTAGAGETAGVRNADRTIHTPSAAQVIDAAGDVILANATYIQISNTTGGSITLTSTPTIAAGASGQIIEIINVGTQDVVIQDQGTLANSNLRLETTTITLQPRDSIRLRYNSTIGDWIQAAQAVNVI